LLIILFLAVTVKGFAQQEIFITVTGGDLYSVKLPFCAAFFIGSTGVGFADIARTPDGRLWGIGNSQLYQIDPLTARAVPVGYTSLNNVSLVDLNDSVLLTESNKQLYGIRVSDASAYLIGNIGYQASGDLTWYDRDLYMTSGDGYLVKIVLSDDYSSVVSSAPVNSAANLIPTCEGAVTASFPGQYNAILGFSGSAVYKICPVDGSFELLCSSIAPADIPGQRRSDFPSKSRCLFPANQNRR
jgi:hypothetical protein